MGFLGVSWGFLRLGSEVSQIACGRLVIGDKGAGVGGVSWG